VSEVRLDPAAFRTALTALFVTYGTPPAHAAVVVDHLVDSSLLGLHSHGVIRVPEYLDVIERGGVDPAATPTVIDDGAVLVLDANRGIGQVAASYALDALRERVASRGMGTVALRGAGHLGRIGAYVEALAAGGLVAIAFCSVPTRFHNVAWFGARDGALGTNPIAYAFPTNGTPVVADFSTSATPEGRIRFLRNQGLPAAEGLLRDAEGRPSTDPNVLYADPPGTLQPLGGLDLGHKGSALGLLVEMMGTLLAGEAVDDAGRDNNLTLVAIRPPAGFVERAAGLVDHVHGRAPIDPARPPLLPGELEARTRATTTTVLVDPSTWDAIQSRASAKGVALPDAQP
jgi:uncharacterized oxidoreductase